MNPDLLKIQSDLRKLRRTNLLLWVLILTISSAFLLSFNNNPNGKDKLRVKQLIIEDEQGKDRIILSPKIGITKDRKRTDTLSGIVMLYENGNDMLVLGSSLSCKFDGGIYKRFENDPNIGLNINNENGEERGGFGYYNKRKLTSLGMDYPKNEGLGLFTAENGLFGNNSGLWIRNKKGRQTVFLGDNSKNESILVLNSPVGDNSIIIDSTGKVVHKTYDYKKRTEKIYLDSEH